MLFIFSDDELEFIMCHTNLISIEENEIQGFIENRNPYTEALPKQLEE